MPTLTLRCFRDLTRRVYRTRNIYRYVHLPFCKRKCLYCDFPVVAVGKKASYEGDVMMEGYVDALVQEIAMTPVWGSPRDDINEIYDFESSYQVVGDQERAPSALSSLSTIYFGGGTPSLISIKALERILDALRARFGAEAMQEITIEADPGTFDVSTLQAYADIGVTRVSVGVQAFDDTLLELCGRSHALYDVYKAIDDMHASSIPSWSLDLISGLPGLDLDLWERNLLAAIDAGPKHISSYDLQVEPNTPFGRMYRPGTRPLPSDEDAATMYSMASQMFRGAGYHHYELSSYALRETGRDHRCAHNGVYWDGGGYYAFGMGAASYVGGVRVVRPKTFRGYMGWVQRFQELVELRREEKGKSRIVLPHMEGVAATGEDMLTDAVMLQLRKGEGLRLNERIVEQFEHGEVIAALIREAVEEHIERGLVEVIEEVIQEKEDGQNEQGGQRGRRSQDTEGGNISERVANGERRRVSEVIVRLTDPHGFLMSNDVISDIFLALDELKYG